MPKEALGSIVLLAGNHYEQLKKMPLVFKHTVEQFSCLLGVQYLGWTARVIVMFGCTTPPLDT